MSAAEPTGAPLDPKRLSLLFSWALLRSNPKDLAVVTELADVADILIDSGAFTNIQIRRKAALSGRPPHAPTIELEPYLEACRTRFHNRAWGYIQLDKVFDPRTTRENLDRMLDAGLVPMPVLVLGEPYERMAELVRINPRICVAGGQRGTASVQARYQKAYAASGGQALIHALGFCRFPTIWRLPLASGDSSSYSAGSRFGQAMAFDQIKGLTTIPFEYLRRSRERKPGYSKLVGVMRRCGIPLDDIRDPELLRGSYGLGSVASVFAHLQYSRASSRQGFQLFFAVSGQHWTTIIASVAAARTGPDRFDYYRARAIQLDLQRAARDGVRPYVDRVQRLLAEAP